MSGTATKFVSKKMSSLKKGLGLQKPSGASSVAAAPQGGVATQVPIRFKTRDLVPELNALTQSVKLQGSLVLELELTLDGGFQKADSKNELFRVDAEKVASRIFAPELEVLMANMASVMKALDKDGSAKELASFQSVFEKTCKAESDRVSVSFAAKMQQYLDSNKNIVRAHRAYVVKSVVNIVGAVAVIGVSIGATVATWGATGPIAVVAIVRSCATVGVQIYELAIDADQTIRDIKTNLDVLGKLMTQIDVTTDKPEVEKAKNTSFEAALGAVSGVLGIPVPSVKRLGELLTLLKEKLRELHINRQDMGEKAKKLSNENQVYSDKIDKRVAAGELDNDREKLHRAYLAGFKRNHDELLVKSEAAFKNIERVIARQAQFRAQYELYKASQSSWSRQTKVVFGFATSVGLGVGSADSGLEKGLAGMNEILSLAKDELFEKI